jgi:hypothetical protein
VPRRLPQDARRRIAPRLPREVRIIALRRRLQKQRYCANRQLLHSCMHGINDQVDSLDLANDRIESKKSLIQWIDRSINQSMIRSIDRLINQSMSQSMI